MKSLTELYTDVTTRTDLMLSPLQPRIACKSSSKHKLSPALLFWLAGPNVGVHDVCVSGPICCLLPRARHDEDGWMTIFNLDFILLLNANECTVAGGGSNY